MFESDRSKKSFVFFFWENVHKNNNDYNCLIIKHIFLQRLSDEANELLPIFNKTSSRFYNKSTVSAGDWSNQVKPKKKKEPITI